MTVKQDWVDKDTPGKSAADWTFDAAAANALSSQCNGHISQISGKYTKPGGGIPASDLTVEVQASLAAADTITPGFSTTTTGATDEGKWTAIATVSFTAQYQSETIAGHLADADGGNWTSYLDFRLFAKQENAMNSDPTVILEIFNTRGLNSESLVAVVTTKSVPLTVITLYAHPTQEYERWLVVPDIMTHDDHTAWLDTQAFITPLPAGTQTAAIYGDADAARAVVVSTGSEPRPAGGDVVVWVGGDTQPANIGADDVWLRQDGAIPWAPISLPIPGFWYHLTAIGTDEYFLEQGQAVCNVFVAATSCTIISLAIKVQVAGGTGAVMRFGMYEVAEDLSVTLLSDWGTTAAETGDAVCSKSGSTAVEAGKTYAAVACAQGSPTPLIKAKLVSTEWHRATITPYTTSSGVFATDGWEGWRLETSGPNFDFPGALPATAVLAGAGEPIVCIAAETS